MSALMRRRLKEAEATGRPYKIDYTWIPYERISENLIRAIIIAEDPNYYSHHGFDWPSIISAINHNWKIKRLARGASSITQQTAKNLFLHLSKTFRRKFHEALITVEMEAILRKRRILEIYLNIIEFGDGIYGVEAAAQYYFGVSAEDIADDQAAFLAVIIPFPLRGYTISKLPDMLKQQLWRIILAIESEISPASNAQVDSTVDRNPLPIKFGAKHHL
jgi:monofunctional biosynthetic peptidoglycan transglycosylase